MKMEQEPTLPTNLEEGKLTDEQIKIQEKRDGVKYAKEQDKETGKWLPLRRVFDEGDIEEARHEMNISRGDSTFDPKGIKHPEKYVNIDGDLKKILEEKTNEGRSFDKIATIQ